MTIGVNCGHTASGPGYGAVGIIKESEHTRLVGQALMGLLRAAGVSVVDCTIGQADTQGEYLAAAVRWRISRIWTGLYQYILMLPQRIRDVG